MNERAILSLISDLYVQVTSYQQRIIALEEELVEARAKLRGSGAPGVTSDQEHASATDDT